MSSAATFVSGPTSVSNLQKSKKDVRFLRYKTPFISTGNFKPASSSSLLFLKKRLNGFRKTPDFTPYGPFSPVMEWQECRSEIEIDVPASVAYDLYLERERIPEWMPFISSVQVLKDQPDLSKWSLKYEAFGQKIQYSWLAKNLKPVPNQKIHWRSMEGLANKGAVRFFPTGPSSCRVELTTSYEVPSILIPFASALKPFTEGMLYRGLEKFASVAKKYQQEASRK